MDVLLTVLLEIANTGGDDVALQVEMLPDFSYRCAYRAPASGPANSYPLFDPISGDFALEGVGATPEDALAVLRARIVALAEASAWATLGPLAPPSAP